MNEIKKTISKISIILSLCFFISYFLSFFMYIANLSNTGNMVITIVNGSIMWILCHSIYCAFVDKSYDKSFFDIPGKFSFKYFPLIIAGISTIFLINVSIVSLSTLFNSFFHIEIPSSHVEFSNELIPFVLTTLYTVIVAPIFEELFFRGFLINILKKTEISKFSTILISALFFGLMHNGLQNMIVAFFVGIVFGIVASTSIGLKGSIVLHMLNNLIAFSQYFFNFEVSIILLAISVLGILFIFYYLLTRRNFIFSLLKKGKVSLGIRDFYSGSFFFFIFYIFFFYSGIV